MNDDIAGGNTVGPIVNAAGVAGSSNPHENDDDEKKAPTEREKMSLTFQTRTTNMNRTLLPKVHSVLIAMVLTAGVRVSAGDLNPPPGPIAPTQRTPIGINTTPGDASAQFRITQPGSYYLTGNITGEVGKHGIEIVASGVTLDLMGFDVAGVAGSLSGIHATNLVVNTAVFNGSVRNWGQDGVSLTSLNTRVSDLQVSANGGFGIAPGSAAQVVGCTSYSNGGSGIVLGFSGLANNCIARDNLGRGITASSGSVITNSAAYANLQEGIYVTGGCTVSNCTAIDNALTGILMGSGGTLTGCSATFNQIDGIRLGSNNLARGNTAYSNGDGGDGAGILVTGADNHIEGNNCTDNDRGIDVNAAGNFITRNVCSANITNWDVVAGNICLVVSAAPSGAILGNSGGVAPGSTDPNANFTY